LLRKQPLIKRGKPVDNTERGQEGGRRAQEASGIQKGVVVGSAGWAGRGGPGPFRPLALRCRSSTDSDRALVKPACGTDETAYRWWGSSPSAQGPVIIPITTPTAGSDPSRPAPAATPQAHGPVSSPPPSTTAPASVPTGPTAAPSSTGPTAAPSSTGPTAAPSPTVLGGFSDQRDLNHYCISLSYEEAYVSTGSALPAYNNWKCRGWAGMASTVSSDQRQSDYIDFGAACRWAYQGAAVTEGKPSDPSNAYTWLCYGYR